MRSVATCLMCFYLMGLTAADRTLGSKRNEILATLLDDNKYDPKIIPNFNQDYATNVSIQLTVHDMYAVSETSMDYAVDIYFRQRWVDDRLDFSNESTVEKLELGVGNMDRVWLPDTFFVNEKKASVHTVTAPNKLMHIFRNGTVLYSMRIAMTLGCEMDLHLYPFDSQTCRILIQSFAYTQDNINLIWHRPYSFSVEHLEMPQFALSPEAVLTDYTDDLATGRFSTLSAELNISRKMGHYILAVFLPSILLVMLSWVSFWVDPKAVPARVSLGVTCILTMTTQSAGNRQALPPVSYVKMIDIWMFVCLLFVFGALLEFAYVNVLLQIRDTTKAEDQNGEDRKDGRNRTENPLRRLFCPSSSADQGVSRARRVDTISKLLFPGSFILFLTMFGLVAWLSPLQ